MVVLELSQDQYCQSIFNMDAVGFIVFRTGTLSFDFVGDALKRKMRMKKEKELRMKS